MKLDYRWQRWLADLKAVGAAAVGAAAVGVAAVGAAAFGACVSKIDKIDTK